MKKFISILLVLVMLFSACSNAFAIDKLDTETVKGQIMAYYDNHVGEIKAALATAAGGYASLIDSCDIRGALQTYVNENIQGICSYMEDICASNDNQEKKTDSIAEYLTGSLVSVFGIILSLYNMSVTPDIEDIIKSFANGYAETIVKDFAKQLNLATIVSDNPMFFFVFSLVELVAIIALVVVLGKRKNTAK